MHTIFIVTPCRYLHAGLDLIMRTAPFPVRVRRIDRLEDIQAVPCTEGNRLILVPVPVREPMVAALAKGFLWRRALLQPGLPCVLLSNEKTVEYLALPENLSVEMLREILSDILAYPAKAQKQVIRNAHYALSPLQANILSGTLAGKSVGEIAESLSMSERSILAGRTALMSKLGLKNRLGLIAQTNLMRDRERHLGG
ncbi:hypothetical protein DB217_17290 [Salmonella enterica subsp. enterica serovar Chester]|nr:hypothetical protein [Salmonella enterica subsp. enterica serovar Chester]MLT46673.1 hypothetical protein [Salmonella enterica subsp. enterica serovar Chester]